VERHVAIVGAGITGLGAALAFARAGHRVTLLEADPAGPPVEADRAFDDWERPGVGQFHSTHGFVALTHKVLRDSAPDVLAGLFGAGARAIDFTRLFAPGDAAAGDDDLVGIACRRAVFEHVLRSAVLSEAAVTLRAGARVSGLLSAVHGGGATVTGVRVTGAPDLPADLVIDGGGRRSQLPSAWAELAGVNLPERREECGLMYYGRYFQARPGVELPDGRWFFGPLGDLGYLGYVVHHADNNVFTITLNAPGWDRDFRALRHERAFMAAVAAIPAVADWVDEDAVIPISGVVPMGGLYNTLRIFGTQSDRPVGGLAILGDSRCHTNPAYGWGGSVGLGQAMRLAALMEEIGGTDDDLVAAFEAEEAPRCLAIFDAATGGDRLRVATWRGEPPPADPATAAAVGLKTLFAPAAGRDSTVLRAIVRRSNLLDEPSGIFADASLRARAEAVVDPGSNPSPAAGPSRAQFVAALAS